MEVRHSHPVSRPVTPTAGGGASLSSCQSACYNYSWWRCVTLILSVGLLQLQLVEVRHSHPVSRPVTPTAGGGASLPSSQSACYNYSWWRCVTLILSCRICHWIRLNYTLSVTVLYIFIATIFAVGIARYSVVSDVRPSTGLET